MEFVYQRMKDSKNQLEINKTNETIFRKNQRLYESAQNMYI